MVLPDKETTFEEYTTMELLSVAMLIVISTFALDFIHTDRSVFKIVDLDEAWSFLQVAQGKTLSMKLVRAGRAMNAGVYFVTQNTDDCLLYTSCPEKRGCHESAAAEERRSPCKITGT